MLNQTDLSRADLNLLVLFEAVLEERHVGRAASRLHLSPSAVSHGLKRLRQLFNDPLFLRNPKGVVPSERALQLAPSISEILATVRNVLETAAPFDPATSMRAFTIGAPDGVSSVLLTALLATLRETGPGIDIRMVQLLPGAGEVDPESAWAATFADIDRRNVDIAILPVRSVPARFHARLLYRDDFVIVRRKGGERAPATTPPMTLARFCEAQHVLVSTTGDGRGFVDEELTRLGRSRRVALTVPNFHFALATVAETDLIAALPARFVASQAERYPVIAERSPVPLPSFEIKAVTSKAAMTDGGTAWLFRNLPPI